MTHLRAVAAGYTGKHDEEASSSPPWHLCNYSTPCINLVSFAFTWQVDLRNNFDATPFQVTGNNPSKIIREEKKIIAHKFANNIYVYFFIYVYLCCTEFSTKSINQTQTALDIFFRIQRFRFFFYVDEIYSKQTTTTPSSNTPSAVVTPAHSTSSSIP